MSKYPRFNSLLPVLLCLASTATANEYLGDVDYTYNVNNYGQLNVAVNLDLPESYDNYRPQLGLVYSGVGGNNELGSGWSITAKKNISHCYRPEKKVIEYDNDRLKKQLCLNGTPLVLENGEHRNKYSTYRVLNSASTKATIIDTSTSTSNTNNYSDTHIREILVEYPNGSKETYTRNKVYSGKHRGYIESSKLYISSFKDPKGNTTNYYWDENCLNCISSIKYEEDSTKTGYVYDIDFIYKKGNQLYPDIGYSKDLISDQLLDRVNIKVNNEVAYYYDLKYSKTTKTSKTIEEIRKCSSQDRCTEPFKLLFNSEDFIKFENQIRISDIKNARDFAFEDLNNDNLKDLVITTDRNSKNEAFEVKILLQDNNGRFNLSQTLDLSNLIKLYTKRSYIFSDIKNASISIKPIFFPKAEDRNHPDIIITTNAAVFSSRNRKNGTFSDLILEFDRALDCEHLPKNFQYNCHEANKYYGSEIHYSNIYHGNFNAIVEVPNKYYSGTKYNESNFIDIVSSPLRQSIKNEVRVNKKGWSDISTKFFSIKEDGESVNYVSRSKNGYFLQLLDQDKYLENYSDEKRSPVAYKFKNYRPKTISNIEYIHSKVHTSASKCFKINGNNYHYETKHNVITADTNGSGLEFPSVATVLDGCKSQILRGDVNGDGKVDIVTVSENELSTAFNLSNEEFISSFNFSSYSSLSNRFVSYLDNPYRKYINSLEKLRNKYDYPIQLSDINSDGKSDIISFEFDGVYAQLSNGSNFSRKINITNDFGLNQSYESYFYLERRNVAWDEFDDVTVRSENYSQIVRPRKLIDVNNDGLVDIIGANKNGIFLSINSSTPPKLKKIIDSNQNETEIFYSHKNYKVENNEDFKIHISNQEIQHKRPNKQLVHEIKSYSSKKLSYSSIFQYSNNTINTDYNKGLGFAKVIEVKSYVEPRIKHTYETNYIRLPYENTNTKNIKKFINNELVRTENFEYYRKSVPVKPIGIGLKNISEAYQLIIKSKEITSDELNSSYNIDLSSIDIYGNVGYYETCEQNLGCKTIHREFIPDENSWNVSRVKNINYIFPNDKILRYEYEYNNNVNLASKIKTLTNKGIVSEKEITYDHWGNKNKETIVDFKKDLYNNTKTIDSIYEIDSLDCNEDLTENTFSTKKVTIKTDGRITQKSCINQINNKVSVLSSIDGTISIDVYDDLSGFLKKRINTYNKTPASLDKNINSSVKKDNYDVVKSHLSNGESSHYLVIKNSNYQPSQTLVFDSNHNEISQWDSLIDVNENSKTFKKYNDLGLISSKSLPVKVGKSINEHSLNFIDYYYDERSRIDKIYRPSGNNLYFSYTDNTDNTLRTSITDVDNNTKTMLHDKWGRIIQIINPNNDTTTYQYDWFGISKVSNTSLGSDLTIEYDVFGNITSIRDPYMGQVIREFDSYGNMVKENHENVEVKYNYDNLGRIKKISTIEYEINYTYTDELSINNQLVSNPLYGLLHSREVINNGNQSFNEIYSYRNGEVSSIVKANYNKGTLQSTDVVSYTYNENGTIRTRKINDRVEIHYHYKNGHLNEIKWTDQSILPISIDKISSIYSQVLKRKAYLIYTKNKCLQYKRENSQSIFDKYGPPVINQGFSFLGGASSRSFDSHKFGNISPSSSSDINYVNVVSGYGNVNTVVNVVSPPLTIPFFSLPCSFDGKQPKINLLDPIPGINEALLDIDRELSIVPNDSLYLAHKLIKDLGGSLPNVTISSSPHSRYPVPSSTFISKYLFDPMDGNSNIKSIYQVQSLDALSSVDKAIYGNNSIQLVTRHPRNQLLKSIKTSFNGNTIQDTYFEYNNRDLLSHKSDRVNFRNESYYYDSLGRLDYLNASDKNVKIPASKGLEHYSYFWEYDPVGNIKSTSENDYKYQNDLIPGRNAKLLSNFSGRLLSYDLRGNIKNVGSRSYTWDSFGNAVKISDGHRVTEFNYIGKSERISRSDLLSSGENITTYYLNDSVEKNIISSGNSVKTHVKIPVIFGSRLVATIDYVEGDKSNKANVTYHSFDNLDSSVISFDDLGALVSRNIYEPFGKRHLVEDNIIQEKAILNKNGLKKDNIGYTRHEDIIDLDLIHMNGRVYDSNIGRFLSPDPIIGSIHADQNLNRYSYVLNNPFSYTDPSGHLFMQSIGLGITVLDSVNAYKEDGWSGVGQVLMTDLAMNLLTGGGAKILQKGYQLASRTSKVATKSDDVVSTTTNAKSDAPCAKCFTAGTQVLTKEGYKSIEQIKVGELVWSKDPETGEFSWKPVTHTWILEDKQIYQVAFRGLDGIVSTVEATYNHPFYVSGKGWVETLELAVGDRFLDDKNREVEFVSVTDTGTIQTAYNLTVSGFHTYFVTEHNLFVKNCGGGPKKRGPKTDPNAPHNKKIREIGDQIEADGGTVIAGGGRLPEQLIRTPGGNKSGRRPDVLYEDCNGNLCGVNVGKTKADGSPIKREQQALDDLNGAGLPTRFEQYD